MRKIIAQNLDITSIIPIFTIPKEHIITNNKKKRAMESEVYNILSEYCENKFFQTGVTPSREEMKVALNNFLERFYNIEEGEEEN